ncbi:MAG: 3-dehydroquinate synthase [Clostridium sp.]|jgi:3-dehydroquinate synthase
MTDVMKDTDMRYENMNRVTVHMDEKPVYEIVMTKDFSSLPEEMQTLSIASRRLCIVTDSNVAPLYLEEVKALLAPICKTVISYVFPAGEEHKNLDTVRELYQVLIENQFDRNDFLIALGGGVVGDLCGFTAATYLRGISFVQIPTTLLSQVDSSIGGKTGVDFNAYKNMVGAFHMPRLVFTNINTLQTLPDIQFSAGMGEVLKHGLIRDATYFDWLLEHAEQIWNREPDALCQTVFWSNEIKRAVVEKDPNEKGDRMLLNFGHTLGHAIEKRKEFQLLHGECVALGALAAMHLSEKRSGDSEWKADIARFEKALDTFHIPRRVSGLECKDVVEATRHDKKMDSGAIKFILLRTVGDAFTDRTVTDEEMAWALRFILMDEKDVPQAM